MLDIRYFYCNNRNLVAIPFKMYVDKNYMYFVEEDFDNPEDHPWTLNCHGVIFPVAGPGEVLTLQKDEHDKHWENLTRFRTKLKWIFLYTDTDDNDIEVEAVVLDSDLNNFLEENKDRINERQ